MNRCSLPDWVTSHVSESAKDISSGYMAALCRYKLEEYKKTIRNVGKSNLRFIFSCSDLQFKLLKMTKTCPFMVIYFCVLFYLNFRFILP